MIAITILFHFGSGKLLYAPNLPAFNRVIENVNVTFQDLRKLKNFSRVWTQEVSPALKGFLNQIDVSDTIANISQFINTTVPQLDALISSMLQNLTSQISTCVLTIIFVSLKFNLITIFIVCSCFRIKLAVIQIDLVASLLDTYIDVILFA